MACWNDEDGHCCWINGKVCPYLEENTIEGRRWACGLLREHGDWEKVYQTEGYRRDVQPTLDRIGWGQCGEYPGDNICGECGR